MLAVLDPPETGLSDMAWATLKHSREQVNAAAKALVAFEALGGEYQHDYRGFLKKLNAYNDALPIINNWRAAHSFPLNTFRVNLNRNAASVDGECLTAQRIKRLSSITLKLTRFPKMKLSQMQDIGGCRAVVKDIGRVRALNEFYRKKIRLSTS